MFIYEELDMFSKVKLSKGIGENLENLFADWKNSMKKINENETYVYVYKEGKVIFEGSHSKYLKYDFVEGCVVEFVERGEKYEQSISEIDTLEKSVKGSFNSFKGTVMTQIIKHLGKEFKENYHDELYFAWDLAKEKFVKYYFNLTIDAFLWEFFSVAEILINRKMLKILFQL